MSTETEPTKQYPNTPQQEMTTRGKKNNRNDREDRENTKRK